MPARRSRRTAAAACEVSRVRLMAPGTLGRKDGPPSLRRLEIGNACRPHGLLIGPVLRRVVDTRATIWVETATPAVVTVRAEGRCGR